MNGPKICFLCEETFYEIVQFKIHLLSHRNESSFECPICGDLYKGFSEFIAHLNASHSSGIELDPEKFIEPHGFKCSLCSRSFKYESSLEFHVKHHTPVDTHVEKTLNLYICDICGMKFVVKRDLTKHIKRSHISNVVEKINFQCAQCEAVFPSNDKLNLHLRSFHRIRSGCEVCGKNFKKIGDLKRHLLIHSGEKKHKCTECNKTFTHQTSLRHHKMTHKLEKPHVCSYCGGKFSYAGNLKVHIRSVHTSERPYVCQICSKSFSRTASLTEHLKTHSNERSHQCGVCDKFFRSSSALTKHKKSHLGIRLYRCSICDKSFIENGHLTNHLRTHTDEKPFKCKECGKHFRRADTLRIHQKTHNRVEYLDLDTNLAFNSASIISALVTVKDSVGGSYTEDTGGQIHQDVSIVPASMLDPTIIVNYEELGWTTNCE